MIKQLIGIAVMAGTLSACGGDSSNNSGDNAAENESKLNAYLTKESICDVLSPEDLEVLTDGNKDISKSPLSYRDRYSCSYTWPRPDAAEREANMVAATIASMTGKGPKMSIRDRMTNFEISVGIQKSKRSADTFVPRKLTDEEVAAQIDAAKKRAAERLTDVQKKVAGSAADGLVERLLKKNNENESVSGVGDAAFWSTLGGGSLQVLDGNIEFTVSPIMADAKEAEIENAKRIAAQILK